MTANAKLHLEPLCNVAYELSFPLLPLSEPVRAFVLYHPGRFYVKQMGR